MMRSISLALLGLYQRWISPAIHALFPSGGCKFHPTCSQYAAEAITLHGAFGGGWMALRRLGRCHPFSRGGFDPVPLSPASTHPPAVTAHDPLP